MLFIMAITIISLFLKTKEFFIGKNYLLLSINMILIVLILWMIIEGVMQIKNKLKETY